MKKIAIHSVPRSGSTWLGSILNSHPKIQYRYQPLFSYAFKDFLGENSSLSEINTFFKEIMESSDDFINQKVEKELGIIPGFKKSTKPTYICYKEVRYHNILPNMMRQTPSLKVILLIRNPLATLYSWKNAPKEFRSELGWNFEDEWQLSPSKNLNRPEEYNGYEKWKEAAKIFLQLKREYPNRVYLLSYNNLINNSEKFTKEIFNFIDTAYHKQTEIFLKQSRTTNHKDAYSVFKVKKSDSSWKGLPASIISYITNDLKATELEHYLYE